MRNEELEAIRERDARVDAFDVSAAGVILNPVWHDRRALLRYVDELRNFKSCAKSACQGWRQLYEMKEAELAEQSTPERWMKWCDSRALDKIESLQADIKKLRDTLLFVRPYIYGIDNIKLIDAHLTGAICYKCGYGKHENQCVYPALERQSDYDRKRAEEFGK